MCNVEQSLEVACFPIVPDTCVRMSWLGGTLMSLTQGRRPLAKSKALAKKQCKSGGWVAGIDNAQFWVLESHSDCNASFAPPA